MLASLQATSQRNFRSYSVIRFPLVPREEPRDLNRHLFLASCQNSTANISIQVERASPFQGVGATYLKAAGFLLREAISSRRSDRAQRGSP